MLVLKNGSCEHIKNDLPSHGSVILKKRMEIELGGGLDKPTDRDQWIWIFLNDPKNALPLTENKKNTFRKAKPKKIPSRILFISQKSSMI